MRTWRRLSICKFLRVFFAKDQQLETIGRHLILNNPAPGKLFKNLSLLLVNQLS